MNYLNSIYWRVIQYYYLHQIYPPIRMEEQVRKRTAQLEKRLVQLICQQYYQYLSFLRITNNFSKDIDLYRNIPMDKYQGNIAIIGTIQTIDNSHQHKGYIYPIIHTTINQHLFGSPTHLRHTFLPIKRKLVLTKASYMKALVIPFNKMVGLSKKEKQQYFVFSGLRFYLSEDGGVYFALTKESEIIQLEKEFYFGRLKHLEQSLYNNYSDLDLQYLFKGPLQRGSTFSLLEVKNKINQLQRVAILGVVKSFNPSSLKTISHKEREMVVELMQDVFQQNFQSVGLCKIYLRFDSIDQTELTSLFVEGRIFIFLVGEIVLTDNLQLIYRVTRWKNSIIRLLEDSIAVVSLQERFKKMKCSALSLLTTPVIFRNYYKFRVIKVDLRFLYFKVSCSKCKGNIIRVAEDEHCCRECGPVRPRLLGWAIVGVMDHTGEAQLTIEDDVLLDFFGLQQEWPRLIDQVLKEEIELRKGVTLCYKRTPKHQDKDNNESEFDDSKIYDKNEYLLYILGHCQTRVIEKEVVAVPKINASDNFYKAGEELKNEVQGSFAKPKEHVKRNTSFMNGQLTQEEGKLLPQLKAEWVFPLTSASSR